MGRDNPEEKLTEVESKFFDYFKSYYNDDEDDHKWVTLNTTEIEFKRAINWCRENLPFFFQEDFDSWDRERIMIYLLKVNGKDIEYIRDCEEYRGLI